jgi:hypothetical protein
MRKVIRNGMANCYKNGLGISTGDGDLNRAEDGNHQSRGQMTELTPVLLFSTAKQKQDKYLSIMD